MVKEEQLVIEFLPGQKDRFAGKECKRKESGRRTNTLERSKRDGIIRDICHHRNDFPHLLRSYSSNLQHR